MVRVASEAQEQGAVVQWSHLACRQWPELQWLFHAANGEVRDKRTAAKLKWLGVKPGVPDLLLPVPKGPYSGLALEMKRRKGGRISADQQRFLEALRAFKWHVSVCAGAEDAIAVIRWYMGHPG